MLKPLAVALIGMLTVVPSAWAQEDQGFDSESEDLMDESESSGDADADEDFAETEAVGEEPEPATADLTDEAEFAQSANALATPPALPATPPAVVEDERAF